MKNKLTEADVEEARKLHEQGWTYEDLAEKYGVSRQCMNYRIRGDRNVKQSRLEKLLIENKKLRTENEFLHKELKIHGVDIAKEQI